MYVQYVHVVDLSLSPSPRRLICLYGCRIQSVYLLLHSCLYSNNLSSALWLLSGVNGGSHHIWLLANLVVLGRGFLVQICMEIACELIRHHATVTLVTHLPSYSMSVGPALPSITHTPPSTTPPHPCLSSLPVFLPPMHGSLVMYWTAIEQDVSLVCHCCRVTNSSNWRNNALQTCFSANQNKQLTHGGWKLSCRKKVTLEWIILLSFCVISQNLQLFALRSVRLTGT